MEDITTSNSPASFVSLKGKRPKKGIPSNEQFYLPRKDSLDEVLGKQSAIRMSTSWTIADVLQFVFPKKYRESYYNVSNLFLGELLSKNGSMTSSEIGDFVARNQVSKATFYNKVLPRLVRVGMIERNREPESQKLKVKWSSQFAIYLEKIAFEWKRLEPRN